MNKKKNPNVNLERKKLSFFLIGMVVALGCTLTVINMEWKKLKLDISDPIGVGNIEPEEVLPDVIRRIPKPKPKPVFAMNQDAFKIVKEIIEVREIVEKTPQLVIDDSDIFTEFDSLEVIDDIEPIIDNTPVPFFRVEKLPRFDNCENLKTIDEQKACFENGLNTHIRNEFNYPTMAREMGIQEKIYVSFVISKTGRVKDIVFERGENPELKREAKRLIKSLPQIKPAEQRGKPVNMKYTIPIHFKIK